MVDYLLTALLRGISGDKTMKKIIRTTVALLVLAASFATATQKKDGGPQLPPDCTQTVCLPN